MSGDSIAAREVERIRAAYARRDAGGRDDRYTLFNPAHLFHSQSLERVVLHAFRLEGLRSLQGLRILDIGCSGGSWLAGLQRYGASAENLYGIDLREDAVAKTGDANLGVAAADCLPFATASFDLVCQLTMMSSVLDGEMRQRSALEMVRVLRSGGFLLWYDFTVNPLNRDVAGVPVRELRALFPGADVHAERVTLAPPLTRLVAPRSWIACEALEHVRWLRTHVLATVRPRNTTD